jgi:hypothetical protein
MIDQASSLRKLKQMVDQAGVVHHLDAEGFLNQIPRPSPFISIALIFPDNICQDIPPVLDWITGLMQFSPRSCFWDQAGLIPPGKIPQTQIKLKYSTPVRIESGLTPMTVLPPVAEFHDICKSPEHSRIGFLQHLIRSLKNSSEVWISLKASELTRYNSILHSTDAVCIMIPQHPDSILRCYETVKSVHLSGYFSPVGLLDFSPIKPSSDERLSKRIKIVAKQFLALDLVPAGMVLSNCTFIPPETQPSLRSRLLAVEDCSRDFLYCLSESLIYQLPGMF